MESLAIIKNSHEVNYDAKEYVRIKINKYFYFQMHISISQIIELVECENEEDALKDFEKQLSAWLSFHKLGNIEKIEKLEESNYKFILKIIY